jgi:beta-N-acetylhexosaminidase
MLKKFGYLFIVLLVAVAVIYFFGEGDEPKHQEEETSQKKEVSPETIVDTVFSESKKGKIPYVPFIAGQTEIEEVTKKWGEAEQTKWFLCRVSRA